MNIKYVFDYSKLIGRIVEKYGSQALFAKEINMSEAALSKKLSNKTRFNQQEIMKWISLLDLDAAEIKLYFFTLKS